MKNNPLDVFWYTFFKCVLKKDEVCLNILNYHSILGYLFSWWLKDCGWSTTLATVFQAAHRMAMEYLLILNNLVFQVVCGGGPSKLLCNGHWVSTLVVGDERNSRSYLWWLPLCVSMAGVKFLLKSVSYLWSENFIGVHIASSWLHHRNTAGYRLW